MKSKFRFLSLQSRLGKDKHASGPRLLARLLRDEEGSYLLIMTLAIPVFIGVASLASEGSLLFYKHRQLQSAIDAAAYSAAVAYSNNSSADITTQAQAIVASYGFVVGTGNNQVNVPTPTIITNYAGSTNTAIQVTATRPQLPMLSGLWLSNPINVGASATAIISGSGAGGSGNCMVALGNTATGNNAPDAIQVQGGGGATNINVPGCGVYSNSNDCSKGAFSVSFGGNAKIVAGSLGSVGCIDVFGNANITLPNGGNYTQQDGYVTNPYAGTTMPTSGTTGSCNSSQTCSPGVYTGTTQLKGGTWTLQPGIYIFEGEFQVGPGGGGTTVNGTGVTLVFTSATPNTPSSYPSTMLNFDSKANVTLTAPTTGPTAGFVLMGDSTMPLNTSFTTAANATVNLTGLVYLPNGALSWGGNANTSGSKQCLEIIANTIVLKGDSAVSNGGCNSAAGGAGFSLKPIGSNVTLVN
jgi:Flp pilus assembly protein TadG